jgi:hypothetical protein
MAWPQLTPSHRYRPECAIEFSRRQLQVLAQGRQLRRPRRRPRFAMSSGPRVNV